MVKNDIFCRIRDDEPKPWYINRSMAACPCDIGGVTRMLQEVSKWLAVPTKTQLSNFLGTPGEDYFKGNPKSLNFYFLVIWWGKVSKLGYFTYL